MAKKRKRRVINVCSQCMGRIGSGPKDGIKHYELKHSEFPEICYEAYGDTWDPTLTRLVRGFVQQHMLTSNARREIDELKRQIAAGTAEKNSLVTRLNMVILALKQGQPK